jgi:hypothetical protein
MNITVSTYSKTQPKLLAHREKSVLNFSLFHYNLKKDSESAAIVTLGVQPG